MVWPSPGTVGKGQLCTPHPAGWRCSSFCCGQEQQLPRAGASWGSLDRASLGCRPRGA